MTDLAKLKHPNQPTAPDENGTIRFKRNEIVVYLLEAGPFDMNHLAVRPFEDEDREQFAQLIGYSVGGYEELRYVSEGRCQSIPEPGEEPKTYQEGFADGLAHAVELLQGHIRGDYDF